ncbi:hypothetical protein M514_07532 [Trichuris suis]|uniref:Uncharacterized protein n=1 Tax=Trichuris suis TaxID=68888 RepID=A0A085NEA3_9BILA|nr:hypothetical protein M513_07532 [Trichuris suis]KFD67799.1 hypothetical protein M514_07532 [Trichuris suis]
MADFKCDVWLVVFKQRTHRQHSRLAGIVSSPLTILRDIQSQATTAQQCKQLTIIYLRRRLVCLISWKTNCNTKFNEMQDSFFFNTSTTYKWSTKSPYTLLTVGSRKELSARSSLVAVLCTAGNH